MLFFLEKLLRPDIANIPRELSKANKGANPAAFKELLNVIKYGFDTRKLSLKLETTWHANRT